MHRHAREPLPQESQHPGIKIQPQIRMHAALEQDLVAAQGLGFRHFGRQFVPGEHIALGMSRRTEKGAKPAAASTNVGIVDVAVDNVGNDRFGMTGQPDGMGLRTQGEDVGLLPLGPGGGDTEARIDGISHGVFSIRLFPANGNHRAGRHPGRSTSSGARPESKSPS